MKATSEQTIDAQPPTVLTPVSGMTAFHVLLWGQFVSLVGSGLTRFALGVWIYGQSGTATQFALNSLAATLPMIAVGPLAGAVADRLNRKNVLLLSTAGASLSTLALALLVHVEKLAAWHVYAATALSAACAAFQQPAFSAAVPQIVPKEELGRAAGKTQLSFGLAQIFSPVLAGAFMAWLGLGGVLVIDFITFALAAAALLVVRVPDAASSNHSSEPKSLLTDTAEGLKFIAGRRGLLDLLILFGVVNFFMGIVLALAAPLVLASFRPAALGSVMTVGGLGMLCGSLALDRLGGPGRRTLRILFFAVLCGLFIVAAGVRASFPLIAAASFGIFFCLQIVDGCSIVILQTKVPREMQGRAFSVSSLIASAVMPLAFLVAGPLADHVFEPLLMPGGALASSLGGVVGVGRGRGIGLLFVAAGSVVVLVQLIAFLSPRLRRLDLDLPDAEDVSEASPVRSPGPDEIRRELRRGTREQVLAALSFVVVVGTCAWLVARHLTPPDIPSIPVQADGFSAPRALGRLKQIARAPHPVGSREHALVRDYLVEELSKLGLSPEIQRSSTVLRNDGGQFVAADVENVVGRIPGTDPTKSVLLVGHYDSTPTGPGAADDGAAVVALLEAARALKSGPSLRNDVVLLFSDAEEIGLLGAKAFVDEHPLARNVGMVLNFEARGTAGPSLMFETGNGNGKTVAEFARASKTGVTSSLFAELYKLLPNKTDFEVFKSAGMNGLNFAFIDRPFDYHSEQDTPESVDMRSVFHHFSEAYAASKHFGNLDLRDFNDRDGVFFSLPSVGTVEYSGRWTLPLAGFTTLLFGSTLFVGLRRNRLDWDGIARGAAAVGTASAAASLVAVLFWWSVAAMRVRNVPVTWSDMYNERFFLLGFSATALVCLAVCLGKFGTGARPVSLLFGCFAWWFGAAVGSSVFFPGGAYLFTLPLIVASAGFLVSFSRRSEPKTSAADIALSSAAAIPGLLLLLPIHRLAFVGLTLDGAWCLMPVAVLLAGLFTVHFAVLGPKWLHAAKLAGFGFVVVCLGLGCSISALDHAHKTPNSLFYALDADSGGAWWASTDEEADDWTSRYLGTSAESKPMNGFFPQTAFPVLQRPAPAADIPAPTIRVLADDSRDGRRTLRLEIRSQRSAPIIQLAVTGADECLVNDKPLGKPGTDETVLRYWGVPESGLVLAVASRAGKPIQVRVVDQTHELPTSVRDEASPRTPTTMPMPFGFGFSDRTLVLRTFRF